MTLGRCRFRFWGMLATCLQLVAAPVWAHRLDEYLQATLVAIAPRQVKIDLSLTPGIAVASNVVSIIDLDGNRVVSPQEEVAYGKRVLSDLTVSVDDKPIRLRVAGSKFPVMSEILEGVGSFQLQLEAPLPRLNSGVHQLRIENRHLPLISQYLANALVPELPTVLIQRQDRNEAQTSYSVWFELKPTKPDSRIIQERTNLILGALSISAIIGGLGVLRRIRGK